MDQFEELFKEAKEASERLWADQKFVQKPWRGKIKLIIKASDRLFCKYDICKFFTRAKIEYNKMEASRRVFNIFLDPLCLYCFSTMAHPNSILRSKITNKVGSGYSKHRVKIWGGKIAVEDFHFAKTMRGIDFKDFPRRYACDREHAYRELWAFWKGYDYAPLSYSNRFPSSSKKFS